MKNSFENPDEMQRLQQEAVRRVKEMQKRAAITMESEKQTAAQSTHKSKVEKCATPVVSEGSSTSSKKEESSPHLHKKRVGAKFLRPPTHINHMTSGVTDVFQSLLKDSDRSLILLILLLLVDEGADTSLILALMYLII